MLKNIQVSAKKHSLHHWIPRVLVNQFEYKTINLTKHGGNNF